MKKTFVTHAACFLVGFGCTAFVSLCGTGCGPQPMDPPVTPEVPILDAGPSEPSCTTACARFAELGCEAGKPTPKGATCVEVCENVASSGVVLWPVRCITHAYSCETADACE